MFKYLKTAQDRDNVLPSVGPVANTATTGIKNANPVLRLLSADDFLGGDLCEVSTFMVVEASGP